MTILNEEIRQVIDFDDLPAWGPQFGEIIARISAPGLEQRLQMADPEYVEDARDFVTEEIGIKAITQALTRELAGSFIRLYHGTRLTPLAEASIRAEGLKPLSQLMEARRSELEEIFAAHPRWSTVASRMEDALHKIGPKEYAGRRVDDRVHACFSKGGLLQGCSHYLQVGGEVDNHIADLLFGDRTALELLTVARRPMLVTFLRPFPEALGAANPLGFREDELPSLIRLLLSSWAWGVANPDFAPSSLQDCTAAWFDGPIRDIEHVIPVDDADLAPL